MAIKIGTLRDMAIKIGTLRVPASFPVSLLLMPGRKDHTKQTLHMNEGHTLFPTAIVFPSGLQQMFIFSPLVLTTFTHLPAKNENIQKILFKMCHRLNST